MFLFEQQSHFFGGSLLFPLQPAGTQLAIQCLIFPEISIFILLSFSCAIIKSSIQYGGTRTDANQCNQRATLTTLTSVISVH